APDRNIDKMAAIRHLLHASIRMVFWEEDPFAVHLVSQSCDKLVVDCMEVDGVQSDDDFVTYIKPERLKDFYRIYRETYNYLKHAKNDRNEQLGVGSIVKMNEMSIFMNIARLTEMNVPYTTHVRYYLGYTNIVMPGVFKDERMNTLHLKNERLLNTFTRSE